MVDARAKRGSVPRTDTDGGERQPDRHDLGQYLLPNIHRVLTMPQRFSSTLPPFVNSAHYEARPNRRLR